MKHISVLKDESINGLNIKPNGIYVDATLGGAGHSLEILKRLKDGFLYAFDQDQYAIDYANNILKDYDRYHLIKSNFKHIKDELSSLNIHKIDGILFDLGLSSFQIDDKERGFSYLGDFDLDMRMNQQSELTAKEVVNTYSHEQLTQIFRDYGEEKNAYLIAREILRLRPLNTTQELVAICDKINYKVKGHSAKRVFQALRIEVNQELEVLKEALEQSLELLNAGGRIVVITFHSLEDRIVKQFFKKHSTVDIIKGLPIAVEPTAKLKLINNKPIIPTKMEMEENSRSRSAKLRIAERT